MKLILNGGGSGEQVKESYKIFANNVNKGRVMYIPLAWNLGNCVDCINWFQKEMSEFDITDIDFVTKPEQITTERLNLANGIFVGGGSTYKLLKLLKETEAYGNIKQFMNRKDSIIMGGSAGSMIFGYKIDTCLDDGLVIKHCTEENSVNLKDIIGFDCLNGYSVLPHYKKLPEQNENTKIRVKRLIDSGHKLICIPEESSIFIDNNKTQIIGQKPVEIINRNSCKVLNPLTFIKEM